MKHFTFIKRWALMVSILFVGVSAANAQCTWTLNGFDSFGDGWNGGSLAITDNGVPVQGSPFAVTGSSGTWTFTVTDGNTIELTWTAGSFLSEVSYDLLDDTGATVFSQSNPPGGTSVVYSGLIACTPCGTQVSNLSAGNFTPYDADLSWAGVFGANNYDVEWGLPGFTPGTGTEVGATNTTTLNTTASGLTPSTTYNFFVQSDCGNGWAGPFSFTTLPSCPQPTGLTWVSGDDTSIEMSWTQGYQETMWILEYGPIGFTPGSGTMVPAGTNPDTITGMPSNQFFDIYVYADCGGGDTSFATGPVVVNTYNQGLYMEADNACPLGGFVDISSTGTMFDIADDGEVGVDPIPFNVLFQGVLMSNMSVGNNGGIQLGNPNQTGIGYGGNFNTLADGFMFPWGDDLDSETGDVYVQQVGTSPNSILVIQWDNSNNFSNGPGTVTFQIQIEETTNEIYYVYDDVIFGGSESNDDYAGNADIGLSGPNQDFTISSNNQSYLQNNSCVHFYYTNCPKPQNYSVTYTTTTEAAITWSAGLSNETNWTVIYGPEGFDPTQTGVSVQTTGTALVLPGLDDATVYDVYIYADCNANLQSFPLTGQFATLPFCADPTGFAGATSPDSIFTSWSWTMNAGYPISEFAMEYGLTGFNNGAGNYVWGVDTTSYLDTIADAGLIGGALYDVYIQAICNTDSSYWVGPITVTMPLSNDSTCLAEELTVDGTVYTLDGAGATAATGESAIAPAAGTCTGNMTWCNSSITASTWFTFTAPASGNVRIDGEAAGFNGQIAVYESTDCSNFNSYTLVGANDNDPEGGNHPFLNLCGLTPGNTYYLMHDPFTTTGIYSLRLQDVVVEAGTDNGLLNICLGDTVNLDTQLSGADAGGMWVEAIPTAGFNDPVWSSAGLASQVFTFEYFVIDGCAVDSAETQVEVYAPSYAGLDGGLTACLNEPISLNDGLSGNGVDLGGTWYNPSNNVTSPNVNSGQVPGQFNYDYIAGNGVCEDDTANIILTVNPLCDFLNLTETAFEGMDIYPNPTTNVFYITNEGSSEVYSYELTDLNGKIITSKEAAINGTQETEVSVENLETGVYLIRIFNENSEKVFRVVKQ